MNVKNVKDGIKTLSHNIKYLRKKAGWSQEVLAQKLEIKRSNVAVYESKNVEPRLKLILKIAELFNIDIKTLIQTKLSDEVRYPNFKEAYNDKSLKSHGSIQIPDKKVVQEYVDKTLKIKKVIEGQKAFYDFQKESLQDTANPTNRKLMMDIENFLDLIEHMSTINESFLSAVMQTDRESN